MLLNEVDLPLGQNFGSLVVSGKKTPVYGLSVFRRTRPVLFGGIENFPPPLHVIVVRKYFFGVGVKEYLGIVFVYGHVEAGAFFVSHFLAEIGHQEKIIFLGYGHVVAGL
jgi:hypothetical protein